MVLRGSVLTSDSTNYVMLMTFHCLLLICDSHFQSLLILEKALKEPHSLEAMGSTPSTPGAKRGELVVHGIRHGAWEDGLTDRKGN